MSLRDEIKEFISDRNGAKRSYIAFEQGENINLSITLTGKDMYVKNGYDCLYYIDWEVFEDVMAKLASVQYEITDYNDRSFEGTITTAKNNQTILTTLPYDEGWQVYVDGERVEIFKSLDALVAFAIDAGTHNVELIYMPQAFVVGLSVTIGSILLFAVLIIIEKKLIIRSYKVKRHNLCHDDEIVSAELIKSPDNNDLAVSDTQDIDNKGQT